MIFRLINCFSILAIFALSGNEVISQAVHSSNKEGQSFTQWMQDVIDEQANLIAKTRRNIASGIKSIVIVEPTERETQSTDDAMNYLFSIGTAKLLDTKEKMEYFCRQRHNFLVEVSAWIIRKYTFHLDIRVVMSMVLSRMLKKNDLYCADQTFKENFVKFTEALTPINPKLNTIRYKFIDTLVQIQKSKIGITKVGKFCCSFWKYRSETIEAIGPQDGELRIFVADMIDSFFGGGLKYLCFNFQDNSISCSGHKPSEGRAHARDSTLMNLIDAMSKISHIVL